jgi:hypothetical protein
VPNLTAYHAAFLAAAGFAVLGALIALRVPDHEAAPSMRRLVRDAPAETVVVETG